MNPHSYLVAVTIGAALSGCWAATRLARLTPKRAVGAAGSLALAWLIPSFVPLIFGVMIGRLPLGLAIFGSVYPVFVISFALTALGLRYLVELAAHSIR